MKKTALLKQYISAPRSGHAGGHDAPYHDYAKRPASTALFMRGMPATAASWETGYLLLTLPEMVDHLARLTDTVTFPSW